MGEKRVSLGGGQRARVSLARCLYIDAPLDGGRFGLAGLCFPRFSYVSCLVVLIGISVVFDGMRLTYDQTVKRPALENSFRFREKELGSAGTVQRWSPMEGLGKHSIERIYMIGRAVCRALLWRKVD